jgi:hypothetical protein
VADIFVSYKKTDATLIAPIVALLEASGWSVWLDQRLNVGDVWDTEIERQLRLARCVVVIWTKDSVQSNWVRNEAREALRLQRLMPVLLDVASPPLEFGHVQAANMNGWTGRSDEPQAVAMLTAVRRALSEPTEVLPVESRPLNSGPRIQTAVKGTSKNSGSPELVRVLVVTD